MKVDCRWFSNNLEKYFCDGLSAAEMQLAGEHLSGCSTCRDEVRALQEIDPLVKQAFAYRAAQARVAPRVSGMKLALAGATLAAVFILALVLQGPPSPVVAPANTQVAEQTADPKLPDAPDVSIVDRAKPDATAAPTPAAPPAVRSATGPTIEFSVIDPVGYSTTLEDYRGYVLLFGLWSADQPQTAQSLEQLYRTFGDNTRIRVLGISPQGENRPAGTTFPLVANNGSRLMGAETAEFVLIDAEGNERLRGSLLEPGNTLVSSINAQLNQLGIR